MDEGSSTSISEALDSGAGRLDDLEIWRRRIFQFVLYLTIGFGFPPLASWSRAAVHETDGQRTVEQVLVRQLKGHDLNHLGQLTEIARGAHRSRAG